MSTALCPSDWITGPSNTICFKHIGNSQSWNESENVCRRYDGHLAALTSSAELNFVQDLCIKATGGSNECWVGGISTNMSNVIDWKWSDNTYNWNETILSVVTPDLKSCTNSSCLSSFKDDSASLCTMLTNRTTALVANRCNTSSASICMHVAGLCYHL